MADEPEYLSLSSVDPNRAGRPAFTLGRVLERTVSVVRANLVPFFGITALLLSPMIVINLLNADKAADPKAQFQGWLLIALLLSFVLTQLVVATLTFGTFEYLLGRQATWIECFVSGFRRVPTAFLTGLLVGVTIFVGCLLCLVPGLYFAIVYAVAVPVAILERESALAAMKRSKSLTIGHGWTILASFLVVGIAVGIINVVAALVLRHSPVARISLISFVQILQTMWQATLSCVIYHGLRSTEEDLDLPDIAKVFE